MILCGYKSDFIDTVDYFLIEYFHPHDSLTTVNSTPMCLENIYQIVGTSILEDFKTISEDKGNNFSKKWKKVEGMYLNMSICKFAVIKLKQRTYAFIDRDSQVLIFS